MSIPSPQAWPERTRYCCPSPGPRDGAGPSRLLQQSLPQALPHALPASPTSTPFLFSGNHGEGCRPSEPVCPAGFQKGTGPDSGLLSKLRDCKRQVGSKVGISLSPGKTRCRNTGGGIGESGGHGWLTTSREAGAGQTSHAEGWGSGVGAPRTGAQGKCGMLGCGSGETPLGKEGSLHGPEAIKQEVWQ